MSVKSLSIAEQRWQPATFAVLRTGCLWRHSREKSVAQLVTGFHHPAVVGLPERVGGAKATGSLFSPPVCEAACCFFTLSAMAEQTKKRSVTTDDETSKTSANPKKKKQIQRSDEGKQSKKQSDRQRGKAS